jgi:transposase-like protein
MTDNDGRELRGKAIAESTDQIRRITDNFYRVKSQSNNGTYSVKLTEKGWDCTCPDHIYREVKCKHLWAVEFSRRLRTEVQARVIQPITEFYSCIYCQSTEIVKDGLRHNKYGAIQKFNCKSCGKYFTVNIGFEKMKHNPQGITTAMQLYFSGESLRNTAKSLRLLGMNVCHKTVFNWIRKYTALMQEYLDKITPQVSDTWRADEVYVKFRGNMKYLFALMDDETRFWIAQEVAHTKDKHDVRDLFSEGKKVTGKKPLFLITDGLPAYHEAYQREFWSTSYPKTQHIRHITIRGRHNNNKMERLNGEVRDREKVMRGLKMPTTPILKGYQIFHNYVRPHEALEGKTPAEACGIKVEGQDKWRTIIQNAVARRRNK